MDKVFREEPALTAGSLLVSAVLGLLIPGLGWLAAQFLVNTFGWTGAGVLPTVVTGVVLLELFCVILLAPLVSRRRPS